MRGLLLALWMFGGCDLLQTENVIEYTVVRGDTLTRIAQNHGVSVAQLQSWNALSGDRIEVGQRLKIHGSAAPASGSDVATKRKPRRSSKRSTTLRMPRSKPCLKGPSLDDLDDDLPDIQSSVGLSLEQIRGPMRTASSSLGDCIDGPWPDAVVELSIAVGCDGRVSAVDVLDGGGVASGTLSCFTDRLRYVGFPAHDMPDGFQFRYPLTLSAQ